MRKEKVYKSEYANKCIFEKMTKSTGKYKKTIKTVLTRNKQSAIVTVNKEQMRRAEYGYQKGNTSESGRQVKGRVCFW